MLSQALPGLPLISLYLSTISHQSATAALVSQLILRNAKLSSACTCTWNALALDTYGLIPHFLQILQVMICHLTKALSDHFTENCGFTTIPFHPPSSLLYFPPWEFSLTLFTNVSPNTQRSAWHMVGTEILLTFATMRPTTWTARLNILNDFKSWVN